MLECMPSGSEHDGWVPPLAEVYGSVFPPSTGQEFYWSFSRLPLLSICHWRSLGLVESDVAENYEHALSNRSIAGTEISKDYNNTAHLSMLNVSSWCGQWLFFWPTYWFFSSPSHPMHLYNLLTWHLQNNINKQSKLSKHKHIKSNQQKYNL